MKEKSKLRKNKFLRNKKSFIFLLILCLGVGFAFLSTQLNITGNTSVSGNKWSIYFNNVQVSDGSVDATVEPTTTGTATTSVNYTVLLDKPGDYYEFTIDAVNDGTIDAMIDTITTPNIDSRVLQYVNYSATYEDGTTLAQNDVLEAKDTITYKVRVEYKKDISASDLDEDGVNLNLSFGINYVQSTIKTKTTAFTKLVRNSALSDSSINFKAISSNDNGNGLYLLSGTEDNKYPIYYYRGAVENNNAKFAGFCWKVVRTTETGGTKLIYNGKPDGNGECTNTTGSATQVSAPQFSGNLSSPASSGYMYGTAYLFGEQSKNSSHVYGNTFVYENGTYTLSSTRNGVDVTHHYTCFSTSASCEQLSYVYYIYGDKVWYFSLKDGKSMEDTIQEMQENTSNSSVKTAIDNWFSGTFVSYFTNLNKDYSDYLEDTTWCNDRSMNEANCFNPDGGNITGGMVSYGARVRIGTGSYNLTCPNKNDAYTVNDTVNGNGALTYPVGLLTLDEVLLAGGYSSANSSYYLKTNTGWWIMSPYGFGGSNGYAFFGAKQYYVNSDGSLSNSDVTNYFGIRPSISIASNVKIAKGGDGSSATPYEFVVE